MITKEKLQEYLEVLQKASMIYSKHDDDRNMEYDGSKNDGEIELLQCLIKVFDGESTIDGLIDLAKQNLDWLKEIDS